MGSWSEACGFSGMEIGEGEVAYCLLMEVPKYGSLNDGAFQYFRPVTTLLRGTYNDYGYLQVEDDEAILAIFNEQSGLSLKNGENFSTDHVGGRDGERGIYRWWMHGRAFDLMGSIKQDFPYATDYDEDGKYRSTKVSNIGEAQEVWFASIKARLAKKLVRVLELKSEDDKERLLEGAMLRMSMSDIFGYREGNMLDREKLIEELITGGMDAIQPRLDAYRRLTMLGAALGELREVLCRCESIGPQHGGAEASIQFGQFRLDAQAERKKRWGDED